MKILKKLYYLISHQERNKAKFLLIMIFIMSLLDLIGVASIMPFIAVLSNPNLLETNDFLKYIYHSFSAFGINSHQDFLFALGILVFVLLIISLSFKAFTLYFQSYFVQMCEYNLAKKLVKTYLSQPYSWFLSRNSAKLGKTILSEVGIIINQGINPMINLIAQSFIAFMMLSLLILTDPKLALTVGFVLGSSYGVILIFSLNYLKKIGLERLKSNESRFTAISESFGAVKEIKVSGLEKPYIKKFSEPAIKVAGYMSASNIIRQIPRFALEAIAFGGMLLMMVYLIHKNGTFNSTLPILALYVFAGYRLMPALQQIYGSLASLRFVSPSLDALYDEEKGLRTSNTEKSKITLKIKEDIVLKKINYSYPNSSKSALKDVNFTVPVNTTLGIVGATGSGKTTLVDIILCLLDAQEGSLEVDGKIINKHNRRAWQKSIGYVPQSIFLIDDTITANIAFGISPSEIDYDAIKQASKIANLHDFVINDLPEQYQTIVGERGVRLSGGQLQRIGIARALYHKPQLLILDEATSALDNSTEKKVMNSLNKIGNSITTIIIAHRLSTVKKCDSLILLDKGRILGQGKFEELSQISDIFMNDNNYE